MSMRAARSLPDCAALQALLYAAQKEGVSYLVLGVYGRKGEANLLSGGVRTVGLPRLCLACARCDVLTGTRRMSDESPWHPYEPRRFRPTHRRPYDPSARLLTCRARTLAPCAKTVEHYPLCL